jgi:hypothetical protein
MKKEKTMLVVIVFFLFVSSFSSVLTFGAQLIFSLSSATLIILSFSFPLSFMNLLSRVSANSCFYGTEILAYFLGSVCSLCILVFVSIKGLGRGN